MCVVRTDTCTETFFLLEKSEEIEHAGIHALPIEDIVMDDDGRETPL